MTKTLMVIILDESENVGQIRQEVIGDYNKFIGKQRDVERDTARVILIKFNSKYSLISNCANLNSISDLSNDNYVLNGGASLYDSIGYGIHLADATQQIDEEVFFTIISAGKDTDSDLISHECMNDLIKTRMEKFRWNFFYLGMNPKTWSTDSGMTYPYVKVFKTENQENSYGFCASTIFGYRQKMFYGLRVQHAISSLCTQFNANVGPKEGPLIQVPGTCVMYDPQVFKNISLEETSDGKAGVDESSKQIETLTVDDDD